MLPGWIEKTGRVEGIYSAIVIITGFGAELLKIPIGPQRALKGP